MNDTAPVQAEETENAEELETQGQSEEATPDAPVEEPWEQRRQKLGLTAQDELNLLQVKNRYESSWAPLRRPLIRKAQRNFEYLKGNQYISFDPFNFQYYDPFDSSSQGNEQGSDDVDIFKFCNNIIQWFTRVFVAALSPQVPRTRFWPGNANRETDVRTAKAASEATALIERQNDAKSLLKQRLLYLAMTGSYFRYKRFIRDADRAGTHQEPVYTNQKTELWPDSFACSKCGNMTPTSSTAMMATPMCQGCGNPLSEADFVGAESIELPTIAKYEDVPNGQVADGVFHVMHVNAAPWADEATKDPLMRTPVLDLSQEIDVGALRASYPAAYDDIKPGVSQGGSTSTGSGDVDRLARQRLYVTAGARVNSATMQNPTLSRCWIRDWAFNILDQKVDADRLKQAFPDGCLVVSIGNKVLDVRPEKLTDHWTWGGTWKGLGLYPPAALDPAIDYQDRINDTANDVHEYMSRVGAGGPIFANADLVDSKALAGKSINNSIIPIKARGGRLEQIQHALWQPNFHTDPKIYDYIESLMRQAQLIIGITPQMFGGHQQGIDTAHGQAQALDTASGIMGLYWDNIREEDANSAVLGVKCLANNETDDVWNVLEGDADKYKNQVIHIDDLKGEIHAHPETDQGYPETYSQIQDRWEKLFMEGVKNPLMMEMFKPMKNRREAMMYLAPPNMELPGESQFDKIMRDIDTLMSQTPHPSMDPVSGQPTLVPSVMPDLDFDDLELAIDVVKEWGEANFYLSEEQPENFMNVRLYLKACAQLLKQQQIEAAMPAPPPPGGSPTAPNASGTLGVGERPIPGSAPNTAPNPTQGEVEPENPASVPGRPIPGTAPNTIGAPGSEAGYV